MRRFELILADKRDTIVVVDIYYKLIVLRVTLQPAVVTLLCIYSLPNRVARYLTDLTDDYESDRMTGRAVSFNLPLI